MLEKVASEKRSKILSSTLTPIYQSNRITNSQFLGFGLIHTKIFICVIKNIQEAIHAEMNGLNWEKLHFCSNDNNEVIKVKLKLSEIGKPNRYPDIIKAARDIMQLIFKLRKDSYGNHISFRNLFVGVDEPIKVQGNSFVVIHILKEVAKEIIRLDKNDRGKPTKFTKFFYEIAVNTTSKYTARLYILISSWKTKGGFTIAINELRKQLDIQDNEYPNYHDFKKRILIPAANELKKIADCWFNCTEASFESKTGRKVTTLNFKIISIAMKENLDHRIDHIKQLLRIHAGFKDSHLLQLKPILNNDTSITDITIKVLELVPYVKQNVAQIVNPQAYIIKSLLAKFLTPDNPVIIV